MSIFADKVEIEVKAGDGGDGRLSFRHEKYRAKGGPDGGDGGHGGSVILEADHNLNTLARFKTNRRVEADSGNTGGGDRKHGKSGTDNVIKVPIGTLVLGSDGPVADLAVDGQQATIAKGGRGGFGNAHFVASARQAPKVAEKGEPGEQFELTLELKLAADVGLIGLPNAGKSTLLSVVSNAKPEIADYPFTTLIPNLGVVDFEGNTFLVADIPGIIEGASQGKGLGDEFLRHIERTSVLIHLIDANSDNVVGDYKTIQQELGAYTINLADKPQLVVLSKIDGLDDKQVEAKRKQLAKAGVKTIYAISSSAHRGLDELLREASTQVTEARKLYEESLPTEVVIDEQSLVDSWKVTKADDVFIITGQRIEGFARRTDWDSEDGLRRLRDIMRKVGIARELARLGAERGDLLRIGTRELEWL